MLLGFSGKTSNIIQNSFLEKKVVNSKDNITCDEALHSKVADLHLAINRNSRSQMFFEIAVFKKFANFTGKHLRWTLLLIKLQAFRLLLNLSFHKNLYYNHHHVKKHKPAYCHPQSHQILSSVFLLNFNKFHKFLFSLCLWIGF